MFFLSVENFANNARVVGSPGKAVDRVNDNNPQSCSYEDNTAPDPFIRLALETEIYVHEINITFYNYSKLMAGIIKVDEPGSMND